MPNYEIVNVTPENLERYDLFCQKSRYKEEGYRNKISWFEARFNEGLRIKLLRVNEGKKELTSRGFIEYIPAENGWRVVNAPGYMLIHCIWVVGKHKEKGYGSKLLETCIKDAKEAGKKGVAVIASDANWLPRKKLFLKQGFEKVDTAPPVFELMAARFAETATLPAFPSDWNKRLARHSEGLSIFFTHQCPYTEDAVRIALDLANKRGIKAQLVELKSSEDIGKLSPSAYGVFSILYNGKPLSYHYLLEKELAARLDEFGK